MTLTKEHIINSIQERLGLSKSKSVTLVESLIELIKSTLESGENVLISGFGKFCVKDKNERRGRNPKTGNEITLNVNGRDKLSQKWSFKSEPL